MARIQEIVFLVFGQLAVGGVFLLSLPSLETVGLGFYRTNGLVFLLTILLGVALFPIEWTEWTFLLAQFDLIALIFIFFAAFILILFVYNLRLWFRHPHHSRALLIAATVLGAVAILASALYYLPALSGAGRMISLSLYFLISSLLLGAGVLAMLLGHSYLTRPGLSIVPLKNLVDIFMYLVFAESGIAILSLVLLSPTERLIDALLLNHFEGLYLWIRILIGIVGPVILAPMIVSTVKDRATMSATGLLYIAMMMVIIGEICSRFFLLVDASFL
ncbi:MAG: hypothetical protein ACE5F7_09515 [Nitrospiria bacterium]